MISFKGEYEEAVRVMRIACRKFLLFLPDFGAISFFFEGELLWQQSIKGKEWKFTTNEEDCKNVTEPYLGGGEESCKVYRYTAIICVIRSQFSPMALETLTSHRKKISLCWEV